MPEIIVLVGPLDELDLILLDEARARAARALLAYCDRQTDETTFDLLRATQNLTAVFDSRQSRGLSSFESRLRAS